MPSCYNRDYSSISKIYEIDLDKALLRKVSALVYSSGSIPDPAGWSEPEGWTGPDPVLYWSFNTLDGLMLMEETDQAVYDALTDGKVNRCQGRIQESP